MIWVWLDDIATEYIILEEENDLQDEILNIIGKIEFQIELGMSRDINAFWEGNDNVELYDTKADEAQKIYINVILKDFSMNKAKDIFSRFVSFVGYEYFNAYFQEKLDASIKYLYYTTTQEMQGAKIELCIS